MAGLPEQDAFVERHIGPSSAELEEMLKLFGCHSLDEFSAEVLPPDISIRKPLPGFKALSEWGALRVLRGIASKNRLFRSFIGLGYYGSLTPAVIQRNILENPGWYTPYTPYQAEISQGRLEALLNFQTMVADLTALPVANASLLDEGTAAAEAMHLALSRAPHGAKTFLVAENCHPQTIGVVQTRAEALGVKVVLSAPRAFSLNGDVFGVLVQYPASDGVIDDYRALAEQAHGVGALLAVATDLLALCLLKPPGEWGADIALGSTQRFGVPLGYGGPHAAFFAVGEEFKRLMPGRLVGVSRDSAGNPALRLALQTREQHIRREKATSNICTAQVLPAIMAAMFAVYHGPLGLSRIAKRIHGLTCLLAEKLESRGYKLKSADFFDTIRVEIPVDLLEGVRKRARKQKINLRYFPGGGIGISLDETASEKDIADLIWVVSAEKTPRLEIGDVKERLPRGLVRESPFLSAPVFNRYHSESEFLRYLKRLEAKDLSLTHSMIPLGSCTMKLNSSAAMSPITWAEFSALHPFVPLEQARGYQRLFKDLEEKLKQLTGFKAVSLQPNSGAQGELTGLLVIRAYHESRLQPERRICLIPRSAHGTNPASAAMAGLEVVVVECDAAGNIDLSDLKRKIAQHGPHLAALMITYPSTHGVFEERIKEICVLVHEAGAQVYMDGANLNALIGLCRPYDLGADVCHINLHKTFSMPHGGGGPGMGPIAVRSHLVPFLPAHPLLDLKQAQGIGPVSAAPWGSAGILPISWVYINMMGSEGLKRASQVAILNANYIAKRLAGSYPVLYRGGGGFVAHECILDLRPMEQSAGVKVEDVAKRLMDYGFHAPTVSWPVAGTMMVEPTESESKEELDRFCDAMLLIAQEIKDIEQGKADRNDNPLKNAPHTSLSVCAAEWRHAYSREQAAFPAPWVKERKFWPPAGRIDNVYGDKNLVCVWAGGRNCV